MHPTEKFGGSTTRATSSIWGAHATSDRRSSGAQLACGESTRTRHTFSTTTWTWERSLWHPERRQQQHRSTRACCPTLPVGLTGNTRTWRPGRAQVSPRRVGTTVTPTHTRSVTYVLSGTDPGRHHSTPISRTPPLPQPLCIECFTTPSPPLNTTQRIQGGLRGGEYPLMGLSGAKPMTQARRQSKRESKQTKKAN